MARSPSFQFYASDWLGSNHRATMTLAEQGAYINLLCRQWSDPTCSLPDDDVALAGLSELGNEWMKGSSCLLRLCFPKHPCLEGRIANPKMLILKEERDDWVEKCSKGGKRSGKVRRAKSFVAKTSATKKTAKGTSTTLGSKPPSKREVNVNTPSPSPSPSTIKKKPLYPLDEITYPDGMDTPAVRQAIVEWLDYKRARGQAYKQPAKQMGTLLASKLFDGLAERFIAGVAHGIGNNYAGCFPPGETSGNQSNKTSGAFGARQPSKSGKADF